MKNKASQKVSLDGIPRKKQPQMYIHLFTWDGLPRDLKGLF